MINIWVIASLNEDVELNYQLAQRIVDDLLGGFRMPDSPQPLTNHAGPSRHRYHMPRVVRASLCRRRQLLPAALLLRCLSRLLAAARATAARHVDRRATLPRRASHGRAGDLSAGAALRRPGGHAVRLRRDGHRLQGGRPRETHRTRRLRSRQAGRGAVGNRSRPTISSTCASRKGTCKSSWPSWGSPRCPAPRPT